MPPSGGFYERKPTVSAHRAAATRDCVAGTPKDLRGGQAALLTFQKDWTSLEVIALQVNGRRVELDRPTPLLVYLEQLGVNPRAVAVEHNGVIIERAHYENTMLHDGDTVEIVRMVGGGSIRPSL